MHVGDLCVTWPRADKRSAFRFEVVGFRGDRILLMPLGDMHGIGPGSALIPTFKPRMVRVGAELLGRVLGSMGQPLDGRPMGIGKRKCPSSPHRPIP